MHSPAGCWHQLQPVASSCGHWEAPDPTARVSDRPQIGKYPRVTAAESMPRWATCHCRLKCRNFSLNNVRSPRPRPQLEHCDDVLLCVRPGLNHPMTPILVVFTLMWSAAGVKLWRRHQALLHTQWHTQWYNPAGQGLGVSKSEGGPSRSRTTASHDTRLAGRANTVGDSCNSYDSHNSASLSASHQPSLSYSHFRGGVPQWAVEAPTATGTRWQFAGTIPIVSMA
jgi:hypothetical protein